MSQWLPPEYSPIRWGLQARLEDFRSVYRPEAERLSYSEWLQTLSSAVIAVLALQDRRDDEQTKLILNEYSRRKLKGNAGDSFDMKNPSWQRFKAVKIQE